MEEIKLPKEAPNRRIGLVVDGPNILRSEFNIHLEDIYEELRKEGTLKISKVILNQYASEGLIEAVTNQGFDPVIVAGDTDIRMAVEAMDIIYNDNIDSLAISTRDADFLPILSEAKAQGKSTIVIGTNPGFSKALQNAGEEIIMMNGSESDS